MERLGSRGCKVLQDSHVFPGRPRLQVFMAKSLQFYHFQLRHHGVADHIFRIASVVSVCGIAESNNQEGNETHSGQIASCRNIGNWLQLQGQLRAGPPDRGKTNKYDFKQGYIVGQASTRRFRQTDDA
jgi:hypothetical protein